MSETPTAGSPGEFTVKVTAGGDVGRLEWAGSTDAETLAKAVTLATDDAILRHKLRRVEVRIPSFDQMAIRGLHRSGFRREGRQRRAIELDDGDYADVLLYARLASDEVGGQVGFSAVMNTVLPTKRLIGHVVFRDDEGRVLLAETSYKPDWELPGGIIEPDEPPRVGAERELEEETGLLVHLGSPVLVDWLPPYLGWSDAIEFLWDGGVLDAAQRAAIRPDHEVVEFHWVAPDEISTRVTPPSARRIALVLGGGAVVFTEDGIPI